MAAGLLLDTYPCYDAKAEREAIARLGLPFLPGLERANSFACPSGSQPGRGWVCLRRGDLNALNLNALHTLTWDDGYGGAPVVLHEIVIIKAQNLTPGTASDVNAMYLVELTDSRWLGHNPYYCEDLSAQYNVLALNYGGRYLVESTNGGTDWTWQTMVNDIWFELPRLGFATGLPYTPDTKPTGFQYLGVSAWLALCQVLQRIGCVVAVDLTSAGTVYDIVQLGAADVAFAARQALNVTKLLYDAEVLESSIAKFPGNLRVYFNRVNEHYGTEETTPNDANQWQTDVLYSVDQTTGIAGAETTADNPLWDDLPAFTDVNGGITAASGAATAARAADRKSAWISAMQAGGARLQKIYTGAIPFTTGSLCKGVAWRMAESPDGSGGTVILTEIVNHPGSMFKVDDRGQFVECGVFGESVGMKPPDLGPTFPNYPVHDQIIKINSDHPDGNGVYSGIVKQATPSTYTFRDREDCFVLPFPGGKTLVNRIEYKGRLIGYYTDDEEVRAPLYAVDWLAHMEFVEIGNDSDAEGIISQLEDYAQDTKALIDVEDIRVIDLS